MCSSCHKRKLQFEVCVVFTHNTVEIACNASAVTDHPAFHSQDTRVTHQTMRKRKAIATMPLCEVSKSDRDEGDLHTQSAIIVHHIINRSQRNRSQSYHRACPPPTRQYATQQQNRLQ